MTKKESLPDWAKLKPETLNAKLSLITRKKHYLKTKGARGQFLRNLLKEVNQEWSQIADKAKAQDPLAFFKPSYDQALLLNSWMWGICFIAVYTANRIGKTAAMVIDKVLWIHPNDPNWSRSGIFKPYLVGDPIDDPQNKDNPYKGRLVQVYPRPPIECIQKIAKTIRKLGLKPDPMSPPSDPSNAEVLAILKQHIPECYESAYPFAPMNFGGTIWMGAPDQENHENIVMPIWEQYLPSRCIERRSYTDREFTFKIQGERTTYWEWIGKSYESKDTKWSGKAVQIICLTEGVTPKIMREVNVRFTDPGVGSHDFTPYEPANVGGSEALAKSIKSGKFPLSLPSFVFTGFKVYNAPTHIIPEDKRLGLINAFKDHPEGRARLEGEFYTSSGLVLDNLSREVHLLDWSIAQMKALYPNGRFYRGIDPGLDHPTACAWAMITPSNQWIIYRIMAERGLDIPTRCSRIIKLSNNKPVKIYYGKQRHEFYLTESNVSPESEIFNATIADYHVFKKDEVSGLPYAQNYISNGLSIIESTHIGPEYRAQKMNELLGPSPYYPALQSLQIDPRSNRIVGDLSMPGGAQVYFLRNGPGVMEWFLKMEEFYWERMRGGDNKGAPKDKVPEEGDDELDAICYVVCSQFRWTSFRPPAKYISGPEAEPESHLTLPLQNRRRTQPNHSHLQPLQNVPMGAGHFGQTEFDNDDD